MKIRTIDVLNDKIEKRREERRGEERRREKEIRMKNEIGEKEVKMKNEKGTSTNTQVHTQTNRLRGEATYLCIV